MLYNYETKMNFDKIFRLHLLKCHTTQRIFSEKVMFLEISTSSDRPVPLMLVVTNVEILFPPIRVHILTA